MVHQFQQHQTHPPHRSNSATDCAARYAGCVSAAGVVWTCEAEGAEIRLCSQCLATWRIRASQVPQLRQRCPRCADLAVCADADRESVAPVGPLRVTGAAAPSRQVLPARSRCYLTDCCEMDPTCLLFASCEEVENSLEPSCGVCGD